MLISFSRSKWTVCPLLRAEPRRTRAVNREVDLVGRPGRRVLWAALSSCSGPSPLFEERDCIVNSREPDGRELGGASSMGASSAAASSEAATFSVLWRCGGTLRNQGQQRHVDETKKRLQARELVHVESTTLQGAGLARAAADTAKSSESTRLRRSSLCRSGVPPVLGLRYAFCSRKGRGPLFHFYRRKSRRCPESATQ
jgi:hypothetical protein